jgi:hypothetical protein
MDTFTRIDADTVKRVIVSEQVVNIKDIEQKRQELLALMEVDRQAELQRQLIKAELEKTSLDEHIKSEIMSRITTSGTGVTQSMVDDLQTTISELKALPLEDTGGIITK